MGDRLSQADFLSRLSDLFTNTHSAAHGSVFLSQVPLYPPSTDESSEPQQSSPAPQVLIRATNGLSKARGTDKSLAKRDPKIKLSTVVEAAEIEDFYAKYAEVCKSGMQGLRKRDRRKQKKKGKKGGAPAGK